MISPSYCNSCGLAKRGRIPATYAATLQLISDRGTVSSEVQVLLCDEHMQQAHDADDIKVAKCCTATETPPPPPAPEKPPPPVRVPKPSPPPPPSPTPHPPPVFMDDALFRWLGNNGATPQVRKAIAGFIVNHTNLLDTADVNKSVGGLNVRVGDHTLAIMVRAWLAGQLQLRVYAVDGSVRGLPLEEVWTNDDTPEGIVAMLRSASDRFIMHAFYVEKT